ncbi:AAA family ATPase [Streptomyces pathocidini]|uniref:AAA family ATPase n=1 Tax=Streptomyces pathocidini TaxID=1650571 RepID=UPI00099E8AAD|nr:AAA family ATPase [Streptomyces pathocidini]
MDIGSQGSEAPADLAWLRAVDAYTMGAYAQAEEEFKAAVRLDPGMADGWLGLHALRVDTATALLRMHRHRDRFGEQRTRHRRPLNSWYWLGWWVQPVLESPRDLLLAHASHWLDGRHVPELDRALAGCPPVDTDPQVRFLHACRAYLVKDWEQLVRHTEPLLGDPLLGIEAGLFGGMARVRLEMYGQAEPLLAAALMRCRSEQPQRKELRYWLARAHEGTGRSAAALPLYRAVHRVDPAFMDTAARLAAISEGDGLDETGDLAAVSLAGVGQDALDATADPDLLTADAAGDGRELPASTADAEELLPGTAPVDSDAVREKAVIPVQPAPQQLPPGPADPVLLRQALSELERMVGLEPVKRQVRALSAQLHMARLRAGQGLPVQPPKRHFVFSGPAGAGKTTVARHWARTRRVPTAHISLDDVREWVRSGFADPQSGWNEHSEAQYRLARRTCGFAARNFLANGISCILDDAVFPDRPVVGLGGWKRHVGPGLLPVVLLPGLEVVLERNAARSGNRRLADEEVALIHGKMAGWYGSGLPIIDNSQLDVETTARVLDDALARAIASLPPA